MSTESTAARTPRNLTERVSPPAAPIAASTVRQAVLQVSAEIRYVRADTAATRVARSTPTAAHPYSSFEQGGVRRFDRSAFARGTFARGPFDGGQDLPPFRVS